MGDEGPGGNVADSATLYAMWRRAMHDVRGPLAVVLGQAELLLEEVYGPLTDKQRYALLKIQSNGDKMNERMTSESARLREVLGLED